MLIRRAHIPAELVAGRTSWPLTVPSVAASTIIEAIAEAFGLDSRGGRAGRKYGNDREKTVLGQLLRLEMTAAGGRMLAGPRTKEKGY